MTKTMAKVLAAHRTIDVALYPDYYCCSCGHKGLEQPSAHQAAMLTAAGFGSVKEAKAEAWGEGWSAGAGWPQDDVNPYRA